MQSKIVINILAICACSGLTAFFALNTIDFINVLASEKVAIERQELLRQEDIITQKTKTLQSNLNEVIAKKEALEKSIAESEIITTPMSPVERLSVFFKSEVTFPMSVSTGVLDISIPRIPDINCRLIYAK